MKHYYCEYEDELEVKINMKDLYFKDNEEYDYNE